MGLPRYDSIPRPKIFLVLNQTYNVVGLVLNCLLASCDFLLKEEGLKSLFIVFDTNNSCNIFCTLHINEM